jgi:hypothetical protein
MTVRTKVVPWVGGDLRVCVDLVEGGFLKVAVLDEKRKMRGEGLIQGQAGTLTDTPFVWEQGFDPAIIRGQKVCLAFKAAAATLYSFSFGPAQ